MSDCHNVEMRELLPDLLHGVLRSAERLRVQDHLAGCADCRSELQVLTVARQALTRGRVPVIDTASIVRALPKPVVVGSATAGRSTAWRIAAAVAVLVLGGAALAYLRPAGESVPSLVSNPSQMAPGNAELTVPGSVQVAPRIVAQTKTAGSVDGRSGMTADGGVEDLDDADLEALIGALENIDAIPLPTAPPVSGRRFVGEASGGVGE